MISYERNSINRWERRDAKKLSKKKFASDNRVSVRWLYLKSGRRAKKDANHLENMSSM